VTLLTAEKEKSIVQLLSNIYDYKSFKDKIYLIKACEASGNRILINYYKSLLSKEECSVYK
jgi:hypothetical protein